MNGMDQSRPYEDWHQLFDAICIERGHENNATLARDFCAQLGTRDEAAFESAVKSLGNWRRGVHTPHRRNFAALTKVLGIETDPVRLKEWNDLYSAAKSANKASSPDPEEDVPADAPLPPPKRASWLRSPVVGGAVAAVILVVGYAVYESIAYPRHSLPPEMIISRAPIDMNGERIYWREITDLKVGDYAVIHAKRGNCGEQPPTWEETAEFLPELPIGVWFDGGVGYRISRSCGGATPARAVVLKATVPGTVKFMLYEDPVTITVE